MTSQHQKDEKAARGYCREKGDDCLTDRTQPGTPVGECIYIFCGCDLYDAVIFGIAHARAQDAEWVKALEKTVNIAVKFRDKLSNYAIGCAVVTEEGMDDVDNALLSAFAELEKLRKEREGAK